MEDLGISLVEGGKFNVSVSGRPLSAVLENLFDLAGVRLPVDPGLDKKEVTVAVEACGFWKALDSILAAGNAYLWGAFVPVEPRIRAIPQGFEPNKAVSYAGPVRVSVEEVVINHPLGPAEAAKAPVEIRAWLLPEPGHGLLFEPGLSSETPDAKVEAVDDLGNAIAVRGARLTRIGRGLRLLIFADSLSKGAVSISKLSIQISLEVSGGVEEVLIQDLDSKTGTEETAGELRVKIEETAPSSLSFLVSGKGLPRSGRFMSAGAGRRPEFALTDAGDNPVQATRFWIEGAGESVRYRLELPDDRPSPLSLKFRGLKSRERISAAIDFADIGLGK